MKDIIFYSKHDVVDVCWPKFINLLIDRANQIQRRIQGVRNTHCSNLKYIGKTCNAYTVKVIALTG